MSSTNCLRCKQDYAYGCSCSAHELADWLADRVINLEAALLKIDQLESKSFSMRDADQNFKECGKIAREILA